MSKLLVAVAVLAWAAAGVVSLVAGYWHEAMIWFSIATVALGVYAALETPIRQGPPGPPGPPGPAGPMGMTGGM
jgi:hypothetical protein